MQSPIINPPIDNPQSAIPNALLPPSTGIDTMQQSSTKHNENSCAHAREDYPTTLSFKQIEFLRWLPTEHTITAAAEKAGINRATFYRWIKEPAFKAEYEYCRSLALTIAKAEISALSLDAAELLHECLQEGYHPQVRVHAAGTILRNAQRLTQANHSAPAPTPALAPATSATPAPTPATLAPTPATLAPATSTTPAPATPAPATLAPATSATPAPTPDTLAPTPAIPAPAPTHAIPVPTPVIPAKAGIQRSVSPPTHRNTPTAAHRTTPRWSRRVHIRTQPGTMEEERS